MSMTLRRNTNPSQAAPSQAAVDGQPPEAETRMRRALGLLPSGPRARTRGGDGPLVEHRGDRHGGSSVNRVATAEAALAEERAAREQLGRQLRDMEAALREAQTKAGHAELARDELQAALATERTARETAEEQIRRLLAEADQAIPATLERRSGQTERRGGGKEAVETPKKRRGRPPGSVSKARRAPTIKVAEPKATEPMDDEAEAVEWWVPGWQERY